VGLRAGLDRREKILSPPGFDSWTVQPVGSGHTDYANRPTAIIVHKEIFGNIVVMETQYGMKD